MNCIRLQTRQLAERVYVSFRESSGKEEPGSTLWLHVFLVIQIMFVICPYVFFAKTILHVLA